MIQLSILIVVKVRKRTSFCLFIYVPPFEKATVSSYTKFFRREKNKKPLLIALTFIKFCIGWNIFEDPGDPSWGTCRHPLGNSQNKPSRELHKNLGSKESRGMTANFGELGSVTSFGGQIVLGTRQPRSTDKDPYSETFQFSLRCYSCWWHPWSVLCLCLDSAPRFC